MAGTAPPPSATHDAIEWLVLLRSGEATTADQHAFNDWLRRDTRHRQAWQRLAGPVDQAFAAARTLNQRTPGQADALARTLAQASTQAQRRRRVLRGALALGGIGFATGVLSQRFTPLQDVLADLHTGTGERRSFPLADGSALLLNARSAANVDYTHTGRRVQLRNGECIATVQTDPQRPFSLQCLHGRLQVAAGAAATRMLLHQQAQRSLAVALDGPITLHHAIAPPQTLQAGQAAWLAADGMAPAPDAAFTAPAWQNGHFVVNDQPLGDVIAALRPYRAGLLRITPQAARLRVHGSYPLDDTDRALAIIGDTLPVAVHVHRGGWLVRIETA